MFGYDLATGDLALSGGSSKGMEFFVNGTNGTFLSGTNAMVLDLSGNLGIGTTVPLGALDVRSNKGTVPTASISGRTSFASLVVDNSGVGDIFTASSSGLNRFVITQNGNVGIG